VQEQGRLTPHKLRIAAHHHQLLRLDVEKPAPISSASSNALCRSFLRYAPKLDALIVSDYLKGSVNSKTCECIFADARRRRTPVFVDPKPAHSEICRGVTVATPNLHEAELMVGRAMRQAQDLERGCRELMDRLECEHLLVTRGSEGMTLFSAGGKTHTIPSEPRPVYDVTGAGDTVIAVLALACASGASMPEAAKLANLAAGCVVLRFGTSQISPSELTRAIAMRE
jgi:D-glycero-beta-D-manno-heptose-7-phosphate kinase